MTQQSKREHALMYRVVTNRAVFALFVRDNIIIDSAPYGRKTIGKSIDAIKKHNPKWSIERID